MPLSVAYEVKSGVIQGGSFVSFVVHSDDGLSEEEGS